MIEELSIFILVLEIISKSTIIGILLNPLLNTNQLEQLLIFVPQLPLPVIRQLPKKLRISNNSRQCKLRPTLLQLYL